MAMGSKEEKQEGLFYASEQAEAPGHPFYEKLNGVLNAAKFDAFCEEQCRRFYHTKLGRPSMAPGVYFRLLLIGFFEGLGSEAILLVPEMANEQRRGPRQQALTFETAPNIAALSNC